MNTVKCPQCGSEHIGIINNPDEKEYYGIVKVDMKESVAKIFGDSVIPMNVISCKDCKALFFKKRD